MSNPWGRSRGNDITWLNSPDTRDISNHLPNRKNLLLCVGILTELIGAVP